MRLIFLALAAFVFSASTAQTVDEIVKKHTEAMGGAERISSLKTVRMSGNMNVQGTDIGVTITRSHMVGVRVDIDVEGTANYQVANATEGWVYMPAMGMPEPTKMQEAEWKALSSQMDVQGLLFNWKEKGSTVVLDGSEEVDGSTAHKLKITQKSGVIVTTYIDAKTGRIMKTAGKANIQGQEMDIITSFSDYRQNADGYWFPYTITNMQGTVNFEKIETNIAVDEKIFTKD